MKYSFALAASCLLAVAGCGKKEPPAVPVDQPVTQSAESPATESSPPSAALETHRQTAARAVTTAPSEGDAAEIEGAVNPFMTSQLRLFVQQKGRLPESFAEFTTARMDSVPRPPPGFEYVIDANAQVVKVIRKSRR